LLTLVRCSRRDDLTQEIREETRRIVAAYEPQSSEETARALHKLWSEIPPTESGDALVKAEVREEFKALGVPVAGLADIGKEIGKVARRRAEDFLPLARVLWDEYGREGRVVASTFLGSMELTAPERVMPVIHQLAETCVAWEDCDQLAMRALEPIVRKQPDDYLHTLRPWVKDASKWVRRAAITVIGRLPMKHPSYTGTCLLTVEPVLGDDDLDVRRALSFAIRAAARGDPAAVKAFIERQAHLTDPASIWVLCDVIRRMTKKFIPQFKDLLPVYETWLTTVDSKSQRSVASAINVLRSA
jgi:3-methyladenine DNA glycosylase AlkD